MSRFIEGEARSQSLLFPERLDDWIEEENPVRVIDAFVDELDIEALVAFPAQLKAHFYSFPIGHQNWRPSSWDGIPSERLTAIEQLCHVKDIEIEGYQERFRRTRTEHNPVLPDLPGELMAQERRYASADASRVLAEFADARVATVAAIRAFSDTELGRVATFEGKTTTLAGLVHLLCSHDCQHLSGLQWLLAKIEGG
jgi:hypothetical protein